MDPDASYADDDNTMIEQEVAICQKKMCNTHSYYTHTTAQVILDFLAIHGKPVVPGGHMDPK